MAKQLVTPKDYLAASSIDFIAPKRILIAYSYSLGVAFANENKFTRENAWTRGEFYVNTDRSVGILVKIGLGAPVLAMCLHELSELGMKECILVGIAGGLRAGLAAGDALRITAAIAHDGVSPHYGAPAGSNYASKNQLPIADDIAQGVCVSMSAPYREDMKFFQEFSAKADCVDMETSALFVVGDHLGIQTVAFHVINDSINENKWVFSKHSEKTKETFAYLLQKVLTA